MIPCSFNTEMINEQYDDTSSNTTDNSLRKSALSQTPGKLRNRRNRVKDGGLRNENISASNKNFSTNNLSTSLICKRHFNTNVISEPFRNIEDNSLTFNFYINPIKSRLIYQSETWSKKLVSMSDLDLRAILSSNKSEEWESILQEVYIYSYFKSVLYGAISFKTSEVPEDKYFIIGHALLYHVLVRSGFSFIGYHGQYISYNIRMTDAQITFVESIAKEFKFLNYNDNSTFTRFSFEIAKYDRILENLSKSVSNGPEFSKLGDIGRLEKYLSKENFCVCNSFYTKDKTVNDWYYCYSEKYDVLSGSTLYGKAVFLTSADDTFKYIYFDKNEKDDNLFLVKYEVSSVAGSSYPNVTKPTA